MKHRYIVILWNIDIEVLSGVDNSPNQKHQFSLNCCYKFGKSEKFKHCIDKFGVQQNKIKHCSKMKHRWCTKFQRRHCKPKTHFSILWTKNIFSLSFYQLIVVTNQKLWWIQALLWEICYLFIPFFIWKSSSMLVRRLQFLHPQILNSFLLWRV